MPLSNVKKFEFPEASGFTQPLEESKPRPLFTPAQSGEEREVYKNGELEQIVGNTPKEIKKIEKEAYEKGFQQGRKEGFKKGKEEGFLQTVKEAEVFLSDLQKILEELANFRERLLRRMEKEILEFALAIARKIVKQEIMTNKEAILGNIREALNKLTDTDEVVIKVSPEDYDFIMQVKPDFLDELNGGKDIHIVEDKEIGRGGCLVETKFSQIDARLDTQWDNLKQSFLKVIDK
ncbi:MAG: hypothetical protein LWW94_01650 [Candidatus Desulfofervidaceae bacterium]|nr:hypothetical protein [Candidatus Desulfofervidaceae bacterium]